MSHASEFFILLLVVIGLVVLLGCSPETPYNDDNAPPWTHLQTSKR